MDRVIDILNEKKNFLEEKIEIENQNATYHQEEFSKASKRKYTLINERKTIIRAIEELKGREINEQ